MSGDKSKAVLARGERPLQILSLGWGVQSFGLAAMSALGVLPPVDFALHSDTGYERAETYEFAAKWTPWLEERGVRVVTVKGGRPLMESYPSTPQGYTSVPAFMRHSEDKWIDEPGGWIDLCGTEVWVEEGGPVLEHKKGDKSGMLNRQCTGDWKIDPMRRWCSVELKRRGLKKTPGVIQKWLGITLDEIERMRGSSGVKYISLAYPAIDMLGEPRTRGWIIQWLVRNGLEVPVKSSCYFCPYHDRASWQEIKNSGTGDWEKAVAADRRIRDSRHCSGFWCYLAAARKPLDECDFSGPTDHGQLEMWSEECSGTCFL